MLNYRTGDLILVGQPIAFALYSEERHQRCDFCFKLILSKLNCNNCGYVSYCSLNCARNEYNVHEAECKVLKFRPLHNITRLINRLMVINKNDPNKYDIVDEKKRSLINLMDHLKEIKFDNDAMLTFNAVFSELELLQDNLDINYALKIYGQVLVNSFAVQDEKLCPIGRAVYLGASIFDHSCNPDASFTFIGTSIYIKALRDLNVNSLTEIYISYINELDSKENRILSLESQYYFTCACRRCRFQNIIETSRFANEKQLKTICETIDKIGIDFGILIYKYLKYKKLSFANQNKKLIEFIKEDIKLNYPEKLNLLIELLELIKKIKKTSSNILGPYTAKLFDFISYINLDIKLSINVIDYFRKYYGLNHPRLAQKLYLTSLLIEEKDCNIKNLLLKESLKIAQIITPTMQQMKNYQRGRQNNINNSFLNEIEKQIFISKNSINFKQVIEIKPRFRSASRTRIPIRNFNCNYV